ncbi:hypothetical protein [Legionella sp. CNM-4043-24]|uniref:hypothetical protein n=1 Tax=Legionella sp. CNM-4043-24 TaxID=3421646 RepID=UPI00403B1D46
MRIQGRGWLAFFLSCFLSMAWADGSPSQWFEKNAGQQADLRVDMFLSSDCVHCQKADAYLQSIEADNPWLHVQRHMINTDRSALELFNNYLKAQNAPDFKVPSIFFCNTRWVGFSDAKTSGSMLLKGLNYCRQSIDQAGRLTPATQHVLMQMAYRASMEGSPSLFSFLPQMALMDVMMYTTLYSILALFAFLWIQKNRRDRVVTLILFLLGTGLAHHLQQAHLALSWQLMHMLRWPVMFLGLGLVSYVAAFHHKGLAKKTNLLNFVSLLMVLLTSFAVQLYQVYPAVSFTPDIPVIFQQWLLDQNYSPSHQVAVEWLYQLVYLGIITVMTGLIWALCRYSRYLSRHGRFIAEFSWLYLLLIALILIFTPALFSEAAFAMVCVLLALMATWLAFKTWLKQSGTRHDASAPSE